MQYFGNEDGILRAKSLHPDVNFRHQISPSKDIGGCHLTPISISAQDVQDQLNLGYADVSAALSSSAKERAFLSI